MKMNTCVRLCVVWVLCLVGCESPQPINPAVAKELSGLRYPQDAAGRDLDIVVKREGGTVTLTNRTAGAYHDVYLWLNQQYVSRVSVVLIGESGPMELTRFINEYGEPFPVGEFLRPDNSFPVVLAELYITVPTGDNGAGETGLRTGSGVRYRLLVRGGEG